MMKTVVILLLVAVLFSAYFILQSEDPAAPESSIAVNAELVESAVPMAEDVFVDTDKPIAGDDNQGIARRVSPAKDKPLEPEIRAAVKELVNTSHEGLVEKKTQNGVEMDLQGRFRTAPVATINEQGEVTVRDYTSAPAE